MKQDLDVSPATATVSRLSQVDTIVYIVDFNSILTSLDECVSIAVDTFILDVLSIGVYKHTFYN